MKIGFKGLPLPEGKIKYNDPRMLTLVEKCQPKKVSPYYVEFLNDEFVQAEAIAIAQSSILDLLITDIEKCEGRLDRAADDAEKSLFTACMGYLEREIPLCDGDFPEEQRQVLRAAGLVSLKPVVSLEAPKEVNEIIELCLAKAGIVFFYTVGPKEVHAWNVSKDTDIVTCAGRIHTDLARGFIKADIAAFDDFMSCHNWNDCQRKGLIRVVDRDYLIQSGDIIEIRFNV